MSLDLPQTLSSPVGPLPLDVLSQIFVQCLPGEADYVQFSTSKNVTPLLLCNVCSSWRALALDMPALWSQLSLNVVKPELDGNRKGALADAWLSRSGKLPLRLSLFVRTTFSGAEKYQGVVKALLDTYFNYASRWDSVEFDLMYFDPSMIPRLEPTPLLRSFTLFYLHNPSAPFGSNAFQFSYCPALTRLSWPFPCSTFANPDIHIPWYQLTHLTIRTTLPTIDALLVIQSCPVLTDFSIMIGDTLAPMGPTGPPPDLLVESRTLSKLAITAYSSCVHFFARLVLPSLTKFTLTVSEIISTTPAVVQQEHLADFFSRSECVLDTLEFENCSLDDTALLACLRHDSCASITTLRISNNRNKPLVTDNVLKPFIGSPRQDNEDVLLPNIENLSLSKCFGGSTPGLLGLTILSRCALWKEQETLKFVDLTYDGMDDQDHMLLKTVEGVYVILCPTF